jgi:hypothetical protein
VAHTAPPCRALGRGHRPGAQRAGAAGQPGRHRPARAGRLTRRGARSCRAAQRLPRPRRGVPRDAGSCWTCAAKGPRIGRVEVREAMVRWADRLALPTGSALTPSALAASGTWTSLAASPNGCWTSWTTTTPGIREAVRTAWTARTSCRGRVAHGGAPPGTLPASGCAQRYGLAGSRRTAVATRSVFVVRTDAAIAIGTIRLRDGARGGSWGCARVETRS